MHSFGQTRSARRPDHLLQTPDTFVRAPLPGMRNAAAIVHAAPALGAQFTEYTVEFESGGIVAAAGDQRFVYVLEGSVQTRDGALESGDYAWFPPNAESELCARSAARAVVIEKPYRSLSETSVPDAFKGRERAVAPTPLMGDSGIEVRSLIPADAGFDLAINTMTFEPGASLPMVEVHVMEHGLLMLSGGGVYRLGDCWYSVAAGDFIWMAAYLPQWFGALGKTPSKYLIYKDWNR